MERRELLSLPGAEAQVHHLHPVLDGPSDASSEDHPSSGHLSAENADAGELCVGLDRWLYRRLLELHTLYGESTIPLTQEQLSDLVGGTRPSVNQVLQKLVSNGVVELGRGWVIVKDVSTLRRKASL